MGLSNDQIRECCQRLLRARLKLLCDHGFYGALLMHAKLSLTEGVEYAATDGKEIIYLNPEFVESAADEELQFILMHEIGHIVLKHAQRANVLAKTKNDLPKLLIAGDIIVNSNILLATGGDESAIAVEGKPSPSFSS